MTRRVLSWVVIGVMLAATAGVVWWLVTMPRPLPEAALDWVPVTTPAVLWIEVEPVSRSVLVRRILAREGYAEGLERLERECGVDPLEQLVDAVVFVHSERGEELGSFGVVGRGAGGTLDHERLAGCVERAVRSEGGRVREIEIDGVPAIAAGGGSRAAFVGSDGVAAGNDDSVRDVIRTLRGDERRAGRDPTLQRLWNRVSGGREAVLVAKLPAGWRRTLMRVVGRFVPGAQAPLRSVKALGIGARLSEGLGLGVALEMGSAADAQALVSALRARISAALREPAVSLTAFGAVLRRIRTEPEDRDAVLVVDLRDDQVEDLWTLIEELLEAPEEAPRPPRDEPPIEPDEVIRP